MMGRSIRKVTTALHRRWQKLTSRFRFGRWSPTSRTFGMDRGKPIDRLFIESFLETERQLIQGTVLEVGDREYTTRFGGGRVTHSHVLSPEPANEAATIVGNLETGEGIGAGEFDCIILTQTLPFLFELRKAIEISERALRPGGTILATLPGLCQISRYDADRWGDYWRFTPQSAERLFKEAFPEESVEIDFHGNVLVACAFLHGLAAHELRERELWHKDPDYPVLITVKATKPR